MSQGTIEREKVTLNLAKLKKDGTNFEVVIDSDKAVALKEGKDVDIKDILKSEHIYADAKKGLLSSETRLNSLFDTDDLLAIAKTIILKGEIQLTQEHRNRIRDEKRKKIINTIHMNAVDPKTHSPHPMTRLENAFEEANIHINEFKRAEDQIQDILAKLRPILPIKFEIKEIEALIPALYAPKMYSVVKSFGTIIKDDWLSDGSWKVIIELPAGLETDFYDKLNGLTKGSTETKVLNTR